jgi:hypothetical protein
MAWQKIYAIERTERKKITYNFPMDHTSYWEANISSANRENIAFYATGRYIAVLTTAHMLLLSTAVLTFWRRNYFF